MEEASQPDAKARYVGWGMDEEYKQELLEEWSKWPDPHEGIDFKDDRAVRRHMREINWFHDREEGQCWSEPTYPSQPPTGETFDSVLKRYEEVKEKFLESQTWVRLQQIVQKHVSHPIQIKNAVSIGIGSFSDVEETTGTHGDWTRSLCQLAAFIAVVGELQTKMSKSQEKSAHLQEQGVEKPQNKRPVKISMIAQEPRFNNLDKQLLKHLSVRVVPNPGIWSRINKRSMVYMPGAESIHFLKVSRRKPAMWWPICLEYLEYVEK
jgi:hypothetical protein